LGPKTNVFQHPACGCPRRKKREAGKSFECEAYGGDITLLKIGFKLTKKDVKGGKRYDKFQCKTKTETRIEAFQKKTKTTKKN